MNLNILLDAVISFTLIINNSGPSIDPWGTPTLRRAYVDLLLRKSILFSVREITFEKVQGRKEGRKSLFGKVYINWWYLQYNNFSLGDHTKTAVRSLS